MDDADALLGIRIVCAMTDVLRLYIKISKYSEELNIMGHFTEAKLS
jgi:hypothetical protein